MSNHPHQAVSSRRNRPDHLNTTRPHNPREPSEKRDVWAARASAPFPPPSLSIRPTPRGGEELKALLALTLTPGLGPVRISSLLSRNPSALYWVAGQGASHDSVSGQHSAPPEIWQPAQVPAAAQGIVSAHGPAAPVYPEEDVELSAFARSILAQAGTIFKSEDCDRILDESSRLGFTMVGIHEPRYPPILRHIPDPPPILWLFGQVRLLHTPSLAIVGTRQPTEYGIQQTRRFAHDIASAGWTLVSGLALGVDGIVHRSAIASTGATIAVLGSGLCHLYPPLHLDLAVALVREGGLLVSEHPPHTPAMRHHFPRRNRIVSGLSRGVLVMQSGSTGGSMITVRCALDQDRDTFALPHPVDSPQGRGCNELIARGEARLVLDPEDVLSEYG